VFEVPTTLDSLHELIAKYASTGADASTILQRIYAANSVRSDHRNGEKMQNFYDVLLRRFMAVGDAIYTSGDGGPELGRSEQLDWIVKVMYKMAQEAPEKAGAVWGRRIGVLQNAHAKRLRDSEFVRDDEDEDDPWTAWPSTGVVLLLRAMGRIFPVTDRRHYVVTPTILLLAQMISQTPVLSRHDLAMGVMCSGLLIEYAVEAKRVVPEALSFLASTIRLFSPETGHHHLTNPALDVASKEPFCTSLHQNVCDYHEEDNDVFPRLKLEKTFIGNNDNYDGEFAVALLASCLSLVEKYTLALKGSFTVPAETELLYEVSSSILSLRPKSYCLGLQKRVSKTASVIAGACPSKRVPLQRRGGTSATNLVAIKTLAPRMEDPARYSMSKDKGKKSVQAAIDRTRREYKREHKAIARELRMDGTFIESERRKDHAKKEDMARAKRQKNFAWLEGEQASMNQQVRLGGGLLKGGGTGLARAKAATAKMGIKKGGKLK
jgi:nucleolar protein 14